ncbi:T9SS type A sorting domain-containing protein [Flavobacterium sp. SUN046]|uniref:T9SS type A sorting domain-containing protein n=1 Tax=Flavobacterium sp. SUN046 TaxID=3002440 RepID=UPI002DBCEBF2|nr:T9SS type A sorting domain-containing protein [Flavobacterium sp. SUN046]MEC4047998.1 T9SS type A sorting domain-containing protein [Flavobacterium sp. SUN046]
MIPPSLNVTTLYFYPINGFIGGNDIVIKFSADLIETKCEDILKISFPNCIKDNREAKIDSENTPIFFVSPNPSIDQTIIYYSLDLNLNDEKNSDEITSDYVIEIFDMIGRKILTLPVVSKFGNQTLNTSDYAAGSYLVVLKENNKIIKNVKLIISTK